MMIFDLGNRGIRYKGARHKPVFFAAAVFMFLCGLFVSAPAQGDGWKIKNSTRDSATGTVTTTEEHPDERFRVSIVMFFPGSEITKTENVNTMKMENGRVKLINRTTTKSNAAGNKIFYSDYSYDASGNLSSGERWSFPLDADENITGPKIEEDYNSAKKKWEIRPVNTAKNGLIGKWKVVETWGEGEAKLVIEFRQERDGIAGYIVQISDERLRSLGFTMNEMVYRRLSTVNETYAEGECRYRYADTDANGLTTRQEGWSFSGLTFKPDRMSSGSHCVINQVEGNFSKTVRAE